jgi:outer membrane protein TolC
VAAFTWGAIVECTGPTWRVLTSATAFARAGVWLLVLMPGVPTPAVAQTSLTIAEAMTRARTGTPEARALDATVHEAAERIRRARAGYFPRVDVVESVQRGNGPVFVFSSLLSQRRFASGNFALDALNDPDPVTSMRTGVTVEQPIFDGGLTRLGVRRAEIDRELAVAGRDASGQDLALTAAQRFVRVLQAEAAARATRAAVEAAESDRSRARDRRDAGLVTDADVLAVEVHLADMRQQDIAARGEIEVARLELGEAIGAPSDESLVLVRPPASAPAFDADALVRDAMDQRPERVEAGLRTRLAENARRAAQAAFLPRVGAGGAWELHGDAFADRRSSWIVGAQVELNLFRGFADAAQLAEARYAEDRAELEQAMVDRRVAVEVRAALARVATARAREAAGQAALGQARESQRIVRDRYETGLATMTDVLRAAEAALAAESRVTAAEMDTILQTIALDRAVGRL